MNRLWKCKTGPGVRLVAKLDKCSKLDAWIAAMGEPASVDVLLTHSVETVVNKEVIRALVPERNNYSLMLLRAGDCLDSIRISQKNDVAGSSDA